MPFNPKLDPPRKGDLIYGWRAEMGRTPTGLCLVLQNCFFEDCDSWFFKCWDIDRGKVIEVEFLKESNPETWRLQKSRIKSS